MSDDRAVKPDVVRAIEEMAQHVARRPFSRDLIHRLEWLVELLIDRGYLEPAHRALVNRTRGDGSVVRLSLYPDKRAVTSLDPGCAERLHLCHARCCAMDIALSAEDLREGLLTWDLEQPYLLRKAAHGNCEHLDGDGRCGAYEHRPGACRAYDCVDDPRVWLDYERRIPAPMPWWLIPLDDRGLAPEEHQARAAARFAAAPPREDSGEPA